MPADALLWGDDGMCNVGSSFSIEDGVVIHQDVEGKDHGAMDAAEAEHDAIWKSLSVEIKAAVTAVVEQWNSKYDNISIILEEDDDEEEEKEEG